jgi:hypothetical protein
MDSEHTRLKVRLNDLLHRLEAQGVPQAAAKLRRIAIEPESSFGSAADWVDVVIETLTTVRKHVNAPKDLCSELDEARRHAQGLLYGHGKTPR